MKPTLNARGGINKTSKREQEGLVSSGATGMINNLQTVTPVTQQASVIPSDVIDNPQDPIDIPQPTFDETIPKSAVAAGQSFVADTQARADELSKQYNNDTDMIRALNAQLGLETQDRNQLEQQAGLPDSRALLNQRLSQIKRKTDQIANLDNLATIQQGQLEGKGTDSRLISRSQAAIARDRQFERATQSMELRSQIADAELLQGNINAAVAEIDAALDAKYSPIEQNLKLEIELLSNTKDFLTSAQSEAADARIEQYRQEVNLIEDARAAVNAAVSSGGMEPGEAEALMKLSPDEQISAANEVIARVSRETLALEREGIRADNAASWALANQRIADTGGTYTNSEGVDVQVPSFDEWLGNNGVRGDIRDSLSPQKMDELRAEYDSDIEVVNRAVALDSVSPLAREILKNPKGFFDLTPTKRGEILEELANAGIDTASIQDGKKKSLSATQVDDLAQAQIARQNVVTLYNMLQELPGTGPISGRLRGLNPYDPQVVAINAQINRTVPGLARGVFKEVGVLTDQDVERYRNTLANQNFTDEQIEKLHSDTLSIIDESIGITTGLYEQLGYDVTNFEANASDAPGDGLSDDEAWDEYQKQVNSNE